MFTLVQTPRKMEGRKQGYDGLEDFGSRQVIDVFDLSTYFLANPTDFSRLENPKALGLFNVKGMKSPKRPQKGQKGLKVTRNDSTFFQTTVT